MHLFRRAHPKGADAGFTLIETLVAMAIFSIVAATAVWGLRSYQRAQELSGTAHGVVSALRNVAERSQSEGRTYCVNFSTTSWSVWRYSCDPTYTTSAGAPSTQVLGSQQVQGTGITLGSASFDPGVSVGACPATLACVYFYPRGTASNGSLQVSRGSKVYTVNVVGLTGRVYLG